MRIAALVIVAALACLGLAAQAGAAQKKFAVKTTVEAELGPDGQPTGYLTGKVTSTLPYCTRKANIEIGSLPEDTGIGAVTETDGKGVWRALPGQFAGRTVVVVVKPPNGYGPMLNAHTRAVCKSFRAKVAL